jgi:hypothetical protein
MLRIKKKKNLSLKLKGKKLYIKKKLKAISNTL